MIELIGLTDIQAVKGISANVNVAKMITPHILEAQDFDFRPLVGDEFYYALVEDAGSSPAFGDFPNLMDEHDYTYNGKTYKHPGIKKVLAYFAYARYKANGNTHDTASGTFVKTNEFSVPVSSKEIERQVNQARAGAVAYWNQIAMFLDRNRTIYPLWSCNTGSRPTGGIRIRAIGARKVGSSRCCQICGRYSYCNC